MNQQAEGPSGSYTVMEGDYLAFQRLFYRRSFRRFWYFFIPFMMLLGGLALGGVFDRAVMLGAAIGAPIAPAVIWLTAWLVLIPRNVRRVYAETAVAREHVMVQTSAEGIAFKQESGAFRLKWADLARWDENEAIMALFVNRGLAHILPKRDLSPAFTDYVRDRLHASGLHEKWKLRR